MGRSVTMTISPGKESMSFDTNRRVIFSPSIIVKTNMPSWPRAAPGSTTLTTWIMKWEKARKLETPPDWQWGTLVLQELARWGPSPSGGRWAGRRRRQATAPDQQLLPPWSQWLMFSSLVTPSLTWLWQHPTQQRWWPVQECLGLLRSSLNIPHCPQSQSPWWNYFLYQ